jgi:hypothetical protein
VHDGHGLVHPRVAVLQEGQSDVEPHLHLLPLVQDLLEWHLQVVQQVPHRLPHSPDVEVVQLQRRHLLGRRTHCLLTLFHCIIGQRIGRRRRG